MALCPRCNQERGFNVREVQEDAATIYFLDCVFCGEVAATSFVPRSGDEHLSELPS
jgi:hypothetical protein